MIEVKDATYRYAKSDTPVFAGFSAQFARGEITAITGKNGCGKTTLTKLLAGILHPAAGRVSIDGLDVSNMNLFEIGQHVGYLFQNPNRQLFCDTVFNEVAYGLRNLGFDENQAKKETEQYLDYFGLLGSRDAYPGKLSHGEKQRLALAAVLALNTDYLVLDEPTTGLDVRRQRELGELLLDLRREFSCGIMFVSHETEFAARYADRELTMKNSELEPEFLCPAHP